MSNLKLILKKVDAKKYGIITGTLMALLVFVMLLIAFLFTSLLGLGFNSSELELGYVFGGGFLMVILGPIVYFIFGFIFGYLGALLLNFILKKTNGLALEFDKTNIDLHQIGKE